jgi:hypothetical protein
VWKLLIIEPFFSMKIKKKKKMKTLLEFGGVHDIVGKPSTSQI